MPPELQAFLQATGRLPENELDLQAFLQAQNAPGSFGAGAPLPPGAGFTPPPPAGIAGPQFGPIGAPGGQFGAVEPSPVVDVARQTAFDNQQPVPGGAFGPPVGQAPQGLEAPVTQPAPQESAPPADSAARLGSFFGNVAGGVARARLGGDPKGFSFTQESKAPGGRSVGPVDFSKRGSRERRFGAIPSVKSSGIEDVFAEENRQAVLEEASKREAQSQLLGSIISALTGGGGGGLEGLLGGGEKRDEDRTKFGGKKRLPRLREAF